MTRRRARRSKTSRSGGKGPGSALDAGLLAGKRRAAPPHEFVLEAIERMSPVTRPMFGCLAVYIQDKIVLFLRDHHDRASDNGVWLATTAQHHDSLRREFPHMRSIRLLGREVTHWQVLPAEAPDFEKAALRACELICAGDPRIGKVPNRQLAKRSGKKKSLQREHKRTRRH
jgi:hypothetical protein